MPGLERIEYKPVSVRELFLEMKNSSELMIDLAYSAALFNDEELAEDVLELENRIDTLTYLLEIEIMLAARDVEDAYILAGVSKVASAADKISDAAADITAIVTQKLGIHPIISKGFEKVEERLIRVKIAKGSVLIGKKIKSLDLAARMGVDIIAIRRSNNWMINPDNSTVLVVGDFLIARGAPQGITSFKELGEGVVHRVVPNKTNNLSDNQQFEKIVERFVELKNTSEIMMDLAYSSLLLNSKELAEDVQKLERHVDNLHTNFELLVLSSKFSAREVKSFLGLIRLGVVTEKIADAAADIAEVVLRGIEPHPILKLAIEEAEETVTYVEVAATSSLVGKTLREAKIPEQTGMWVLALRSDGKWLRPKPHIRIRPGQLVIASGYAEGEKDLVKLLS